VLVPAQWGFPTETSRLLINARVESASRRPAFRDAFRSRRCLVPADGFYEWRHDENRRGQPFWFHHDDGSLLLMAGIYTPDEHPAFTILTMAANDVVSPVHDRMPVVLSAAAARRWLEDPRFDPASHAARAELGRDLIATPVSSRVNSAAYDGPDCLSPPDEKESLGRQLRLLD
jgi:putative SOS response-associated peptidase YedK